jgi:hypothetical protein
MGDFWNTLGVAHYRAGEFQSAVSALSRSVELRSGGDGADYFFGSSRNRVGSLALFGRRKTLVS